MYALIVILFVVYLFYFHIISINREGMEGKDTSTGELQTTVFKNADSISSLNKKIDSLMSKISNINTMNDEQTGKINNLSDLQDKYDKVTEEAAKLAKTNKKRIDNYAKKANKN